MTYNNSQGISGKIISISFIRYPFFKNCASGEAAFASGKSGLMCSALKMLTYVLSNKAALAQVNQLYAASSTDATTHHGDNKSNPVHPLSLISGVFPYSRDMVEKHDDTECEKKLSGQKAIHFPVKS